MARVIFKSELPDLLQELSKMGEVYAPSFKGHTFDSVVFKKFQKSDRLALPYGVSILPPKQFMIPPKEELFSFIKGKIGAPQIEKFIIFGVNHADLSAILKLDKIFEENIEDLAYKKRKEKRIIVAVDRISPPASGYDVYLMETEPEFYVAFAGTKKGQEILKSKLFRTKSTKAVQTKRLKDGILENPNLKTAIEKSKNSSVWDNLAKECFGCGICSYVCPLCYCFETEDVLKVTGDAETGKRIRTWDSCMLPHFSETNAGNFRSQLKDRIYNWYFHKFVRMPKEVGFVGCVDCNRCIVYCPAKINYRKVLEQILTEYESKTGGSRISKNLKATSGVKK